MSTTSGGNPTIDRQHAQQLGKWVYEQAQQMSGTTGGASSGSSGAINPQNAEQLGEKVYQQVKQFDKSGNFSQTS